MKHKKQSASGFILVEATVGVVLFYILLLGILRGIGFMVKQVSSTGHRHKALCEVVYNAQHDGDQVSVSASEHIPAYTHPSIRWYTITAQSGDQTVSLSCARRVV